MEKLDTVMYIYLPWYFGLLAYYYFQMKTLWRILVFNFYVQLRPDKSYPECFEIVQTQINISYLVIWTYQL